jgi:hypothetical protein
MGIELGDRIAGPAGTAVECRYTPAPDDPPAWKAGVASWFLDCPGQSPAWQHYHLGIVHLRQLYGVEQARVTVPGATHEVILFALDPDASPRADDVETWRTLRPINLAEQIQLPSDEAAAQLLRRAAEDVMAGRLWAEPLLAGQVEPWRTVLSVASAHARGEEQAP